MEFLSCTQARTEFCLRGNPPNLDSCEGARVFAGGGSLAEFCQIGNDFINLYLMITTSADPNSCRQMSSHISPFRVIFFLPFFLSCFLPFFLSKGHFNRRTSIVKFLQVPCMAFFHLVNLSRKPPTFGF